MVQDLTKGNPTKLIIKFSLPLVAGNLFQQLYVMIDSIIVGKFVGKDALSAVGSVGSLNFLIIGSIIGLCTGFAIPVAQSFGAGDREKIRKLVSNIVWLSLIIGAVLTALTIALSGWFLAVLNTPKNIYHDAYVFVTIMFGGIMATMLYNLLASLIRAVGDSKTPLYFLVISSVLNIVLDLISVLVFSMGVMGVALSTVIAQTVSGLLCLWYIRRNFYILHFRRSDAKLDRNICRELLHSGLPMSFQVSITAIGSVILQSCVNSLGSDVIAAVTVGGKTQQMIVLPTETIGLTMATFCGQNLGANKLDRIRHGVRQALLLAIAYSVFAVLLTYVGGTYFSLLFINRSETAVLALIKQYLNIISLFYPVLALIFVLRSSLQGMGFSIQAMMAGVFELIARGVMGFGFVLRFGYLAVCFSNPAAWIAADILLIPMYIFSVGKLKRRLYSQSDAVTVAEADASERSECHEPC